MRGGLSVLLVLLSTTGCSLVLDPGDLMPADGAVPDSGVVGDATPSDAGLDARDTEPSEEDTSPRDTGVATDTAVPDAGGPVGQALTVAAGREHTCAVTLDRRVYCWGANDYGQAGQPSSTTMVSSPAQVVGLEGVEQISLGDTHSCALTGSGEVLCWGENDAVHNRLGHSAFREASTHVPQRVTGISAAIEIELGYWHGCALVGSPDSEVRCWGQNQSSELGSCSGSGFCDPIFGSVAVPLTGGPSIGEVAAGAGSSCTIVGDELFCWGYNPGNQLGLPTRVDDREPPTVLDFDRGPMGLPTVVLRVAAGGGDTFMGSDIRGHICAIVMRDGNSDLFCWGANDEGQASSGSGGIIVTPTHQSQITRVSDMALGYNHTCAIYDGGKVTCWGTGEDGRLGLLSMGDLLGARDEPIVFPPGSGGVVAIAAGEAHSCALVEATLEIYCWGSNARGQLGTPGTGATPVRVPIPAP